jgi:hypothetical protein
MRAELINYMNCDVNFFFKKNQKKFTCVFVFYVGPMDVEVDLGEKVWN